MTKMSSTLKRLQLVAALGISTIALSGCAQGLSHYMSSWFGEEEVVVVNANSAQFSVSYRERLFVPDGSSLRVQIGNGQSFSTLTDGGPPYLVTIPIASVETYPVKITATLDSTYGHTLSGNILLQSAPSAPVPLRISTVF